MNTFAKIKHISSFKKVEYYSVCLERNWDDKLSLFELFINKHQVENKSKLNHILIWIREIGDRYGAKKENFRNEAETADTSALPPKGKNRNPTYIEDEKNIPNNLRLYCFRLNDHVVFLFNGDIKTAIKAQDCDNVRPHFKLANKLTGAIDSEINDSIKWNEDQTDIEYEEDLEISIKL